MLRGEKLFSLPTAIEKATGHRPHVSTCHRWRLKKTNPLVTVKVGGKRMTSVEAVFRFIEANTNAADGPTADPRVLPDLTTDIDVELASEGL